MIITILIINPLYILTEPTCDESLRQNRELEAVEYRLCTTTNDSAIREIS